MRRMMHAITIPLFLSSFAVAQDLPNVPAHEVPAPVVATMGDTPQVYAPTEFYTTSGEQPYSPLATYMSCNDNCKDFWAGYSAERAAIAARLCKECSHGCHTCSTGCNSTGCSTSMGSECDAQVGCGSGTCNNVVANRYRQSWSTLHRDPAKLNNHVLTPNNEVMVAKRAEQKPATDMKMSLLVSSQPTAPSRGPVAGQSPTQYGESGQAVVSPYLKARNASNPLFSSTEDQQTALKTANPVHFQATLPPSGGKWAR